MKSVALIGVDGAGKSAVAQRLVEALPVPARRVYMGVNLESSNVMLPTTRLILAAKRRGGSKRDASRPATTRPTSPARRLAGRAYSAARLGAWLLEEWYRALVAWRYRRRGYFIIYDRHFYFDYYATDVARAARKPLNRRIHGLLLKHVYPRPDLVILLDAPADVLHSRKAEHSLEGFERRRQEYLALASTVPNVRVVDATQPLEKVVRDVAALVAAG